MKTNKECIEKRENGRFSRKTKNENKSTRYLYALTFYAWKWAFFVMDIYLTITIQVLDFYKKNLNRRL